MRLKGGDSFNSWSHIDNFVFDHNMSLYLGKDTILCEGQTLALQATTENSTYLWQDNATQPVYLVRSPGTYYVTVSTTNCKLTDTIQINYEACIFNPFIPRSFSPNADGKNDVFRIFGCPPDAHIEILNRWGQVVFRSGNAQNGWDGRFKGKLQPSGGYIYVVRFRNG